MSKTFQIPLYVGETEDGKKIKMSRELTRLLQEVLNGKSSASIGTLTSGVAEAQSKLTQIKNGNYLMDDVQIAGRGSLNALNDTQDGNIGSAATNTGSGGSLYATISPTSLTGYRAGAGSVATGDGSGVATVTVTASGGTGPYSYAWAKVSGETLTVDMPTAATTSFSTSVSTGQLKTSVYRCTVTDSAGSPATYTVDVSITLYETSGVS